MKIILGSASLGRKKVLEDMGIVFDVVAPEIDEKTIRHEDPFKLTMDLANAKLDSLLTKITEEAIIIASDQVVICNGEIREKPVSEFEARKFLKSYAIYPAETIGAVVMINTKTGKRLSASQTGAIFFNPFSDEVIDAHIKNGCALRAAGGFVAEDPTLAPFVKKVEGEMSSVMGLSKNIVERFLRELE